MQSKFAVRVHPGELHFNAAHFITFNGTCENLHGHNFHVKLEARGGNTGDAFVIDFVLLNRLAAAVCWNCTTASCCPAPALRSRSPSRTAR